MSQGTGILFNDYVLKERKQTYAITDDYFLAFISNAIGTIDFDAVDPVLADLTVTSGGNVTASYALASPTFSRVGGVVKFDVTDIAKILKDAGNPADVRCCVIYNGTSVGDDLIQVHDLTTDGTTPIDIVTQDFTFAFGADGVNVATV
tara:strand:+ start:3345 stop:3788 length:444 start_codon:yes stop_codon:yes gene_type:complete